ncbi:hypothetical protein FB446DRAFT_724552 [Lentinula raphanica]|nr:hypothetical protein FB446DRAFT_724552 [Lentinula raphanica]
MLFSSCSFCILLIVGLILFFLPSPSFPPIPTFQLRSFVPLSLQTDLDSIGYRELSGTLMYDDSLVLKGEHVDSKGKGKATD